MEEGCSGFRRLFEEHGLRCTRQREAVYGALAATHAHPTVEDLYLAVRAVEPGMSLATVYNTLEAFTAAGLVRRVAVGTGAGRYDATMHDHVHVTLPDGRVVDVPEDLSERLLGSLPRSLLQELEGRMGVRVQGLTVQVSAAGPK